MDNTKNNPHAGSKYNYTGFPVVCGFIGNRIYSLEKEMTALDERKQRVSCGNKRKYFDKKESSKACVEMELKHGYPFSPYQCRFCGFWHVGRERKLMEGK